MVIFLNCSISNVFRVSQAAVIFDTLCREVHNYVSLFFVVKNLNTISWNFKEGASNILSNIIKL